MGLEKTTLRRVSLLTETEAAYIAGLIDGDGCFYATPQRNSADSYRIGMKVLQKERETLDWCYEHTGIGHIYTQKGSGHNIGRLYFRWDVTSHKDVVDLIKKIFPFLLTKRTRAELIWEMGERQQRGWACEHKLSEQERLERKALFERFKLQQTHQVTENQGEFGETLDQTTPSQAANAEGVETSPEIMDISTLPEREEIVRATQE